jgi:hypothetical protein
MIRLTNAGIGAGLDSSPLDVDETQIVSVTPSQAQSESELTVVTLQGGTWYLVRESVAQVEQLIAEAKENRP